MRILIGCWGKVGDIIHTALVAQKIAQVVAPCVYVTYAPEFAIVGGILDLLEGIAGHFGRQLDYKATDLGVPHHKWDRIINATPQWRRPDPVKGWNIKTWWRHGYHAVDFAAACANLTLQGADRCLRFKDGVLHQTHNNTVSFLSNCGAPKVRGISQEVFTTADETVRALGGSSVELSVGTICTGQDLRNSPLRQVIGHIAASRMLVSVDTMASGLIAQSLGVGVIRLYRRVTRDSMTGITDPTYLGARSETEPISQEQVCQHIRDLWGWKE